ncbi:hypothetical protein [Rhodococcus erythropolis]|uniref:hypothetical protein n=1 Tax=Rhodococcus erythropolis TaxID=1833 RepID=UPI001C9ACBEA|nr:hypothetical protein [Rhodococcus erythropolis]MBY6389194.1 hypothetical protein [Rhodococcus erythropolis]
MVIEHVVNIVAGTQEKSRRTILYFCNWERYENYRPAGPLETELAEVIDSERLSLESLSDNPPSSESSDLLAYPHLIELLSIARTDDASIPTAIR